MKRYRLRASPRSPLIVRRERQSQRSEGTRWLSGTLLRGALARLYLEQRGEADERFRRLFLDEDACRFGPLDPAEQSFPLSAASCKREPGFREEGKHGVMDLLWLRIARRMLVEELPAGWHLRERDCPVCGQDLKAIEGFWSRTDGKPRQHKKLWRQGADTHVGIDRYVSSSHESILYTLPVMQPRTWDIGTDAQAVLTGVLEADDEIVAELRDLLKDEGGEVRVGHARTRGYGRLMLEIQEEQTAEAADLEAWSRELIAFLRRINGDKFRYLDPERHLFFSLGLPNGALLLDRVLRYTLDPSGLVDWLPPLPPPTLECLPGFENGEPRDGLWCLGAIARHERLRGWNAAHGLPRQDEWAVIRGAVYAYLFQGSLDERQALKEKLAALAQTGIGARRCEGLGRVLLSDRFHQDFQPQEKTS